MFLRCKYLCVSVFLSGSVFLFVCPFKKGPVSICFIILSLGFATCVSLFSWWYWYLGGYLSYHFSRSPALQQLFCTYQILSCTGYSLEHRNNLSRNGYFTNWVAISRYRNVNFVYRVLFLVLPFWIVATYLTNSILIRKESRTKSVILKDGKRPT